MKTITLSNMEVQWFKYSGLTLVSSKVHLVRMGVVLVLQLHYFYQRTVCSATRPSFFV